MKERKKERKKERNPVLAVQKRGVRSNAHNRACSFRTRLEVRAYRTLAKETFFSTSSSRIRGNADICLKRGCATELVEKANHPSLAKTLSRVSSSLSKKGDEVAENDCNDDREGEGGREIKKESNVEEDKRFLIAL